MKLQSHPDNQLIHEQVENSVEMLLNPSQFINLVELQIWVKVGSLHEKPQERGLAHYLEHMIFKGTAKNGVGEISRRFEAMGGEINAYTTFEYTVFHGSVLGNFAEEALTIMADALLHASLDEGEFEREKLVILEEVKRSLDSPSSLVGQKVFATLFEGCEAARPIIGDLETVAKYRREDLVQFYKKWYRTDQMTLVVSGAFSGSSMRNLAVELFPPLPAGHNLMAPLVRQHSVKSPVIQVLKGDYKQPQVEIAFRGPDVKHTDAVLMDLFCFVWGSGDISRLNRALRFENSLFSAIGAQSFAPGFGGILSISGLIREESLVAGVRAVAEQIVRLKYQEPITNEELERAKITLESDTLWRDETVSGQARYWGHSLSSPYGLRYREFVCAALDQASSRSMHEVIHRWLDESLPTIVVLVPEESTLSVKDIEAAYFDGLGPKTLTETWQNQIRFPSPTAGVIGLRNDFAGAQSNAQKSSDGDGVIQEQILPGVTLIYRPKDQPCLFSMVVVAEGGQRFDGVEHPGMSHALAAMLCHGPASMSHREFLNLVDGSGSVIEGFSGKDSFGIKLLALDRNVDRFIPLTLETLLNPALRMEEWTVEKDDILASLSSQDDSPTSMIMRRLKALLYEKHPYGGSIWGESTYIETLNPEQLREMHRLVLGKGPWTVVVVGQHPFEDVKRLILDALVEFKPTHVRAQFGHQLDPLAEQLVPLQKVREQAHIAIGYRGLVWGDKRREALDLLTAICGGAGGRLFGRLREELGLAYTVTPLLSYGVEPGLFGAYIGCSPENVDKALTELRAELSRLSDFLPDESDFRRAQQSIVGEHLATYQRADSQAMTMALMNTYHLGYDDFLEYPKRVLAVTIADVKRVAEDLLAQPSVTVIVKP